MEYNFLDREKTQYLLSKLRKFLKISEAAFGLNPTLDNSTHAPIISFKGDGATEQQTYSGKNKLNTSGLVETTTNGIAFTPVYENGMLQYVNVNGTATDVVIYGFPISLENGSYILNGCDDGSSSTYLLTVRLVRNGTNQWINNFSSEKSFTVDDTVTEMSSYIQVYSGAAVNNKKFYPMIRLASVEDATYEPYVGGIASPNPDYPQEIHGVGESRNEFDLANAEWTNIRNSVITVEENKLTITGAWFCSTIVDIAPNTDYFLSADVTGNDGRIKIYGYDKDNYVRKDVILDATMPPFTFNTGDNSSLELLFYSSPSDTSYTTTWENIQLEKGTKATPYKAFGVHSLSVKSTGNNLCPLGSVTETLRVIIPIDNLVDGNKYTLSCVITSNDTNHTKCGIYQEESIVALSERDKRISATFTKSETRLIVYASNSYANSTGDTVTVSDIQIELGDTVTEFVAYQGETTAQIPLSAPLYEGDYIRLNMDGSGEESHKMYSVVFDGSDDEGISSAISSTTGTYYNNIALPQKAKANSTNVYCTHFKNDGTINRTDGNIYTNGNSIPSLIIRSGMDNTTFKAWLQANPITVVYEREEEEVTPLTAEQIAEFEKLRTFDGVTHVTCEAESEIQYFYDSESGEIMAMVVGMIKNNQDKE